MHLCASGASELCVYVILSLLKPYERHWGFKVRVKCSFQKVLFLSYVGFLVDCVYILPVFVVKEYYKECYICTINIIAK